MPTDQHLMRKNTQSHSAFFIPRVFGAFLLFSAGAWLAMFSMASTPSMGTLTDTSGPLTYMAGPFFQPNAFGNTIAGECDPDPSDPLVPCDIYRLHVSLPADYTQTNPNERLFVRIDWPVPAARFDLYLWDARNWAGVTSFPSGSPLASSTSNATTFSRWKSRRTRRPTASSSSKSARPCPQARVSPAQSRSARPRRVTERCNHRAMPAASPRASRITFRPMLTARLRPAWA